LLYEQELGLQVTIFDI
ncbi:TPA: DUF3269 family protein, partial [Staphylococcus aureus]|nr:DUF3269 family protein [Staphylococcus aureus]HDE7029340.1 DUF3269 family protein [Staphylococcus aureus]HDH0800025.1 DUF3269 family protein [Staphylococcus aureus]HDH0800051.1 DUF3269 family protein [Staphylococcus aureus]HDH5605646.1 DUF3269 family protein [Staphylococcus aureus]